MYFFCRIAERGSTTATDARDGSLSPDDGLGSSIANTRLSALSDSSRRVDSCDTDRGADDIVRMDSTTDLFDKRRSILVTGATVDADGVANDASHHNGLTNGGGVSMLTCVEEGD